MSLAAIEVSASWDQTLWLTCTACDWSLGIDQTNGWPHLEQINEAAEHLCTKMPEDARAGDAMKKSHTRHARSGERRLLAVVEPLAPGVPPGAAKRAIRG